MEKKVIDLRECKEDVTILFPKEYDHYDMELDHLKRIEVYAKRDPFNLVPKSWEEMMLIDNHHRTEYFIDKYSIISENTVSFKGNEDKNLCATKEDAEAFLALIQLRRLWHEWVKILGFASMKHGIFYIQFNQMNKRFEVNEKHTSIPILSFTKAEYAEKFIECFHELLEKAKILL